MCSQVKKSIATISRWLSIMRRAPLEGPSSPGTLAVVMHQKSSVWVSSIGVGLVIIRPPSSTSGHTARPRPIPQRSNCIAASTAPSGVSQVDSLPAP